MGRNQQTWEGYKKEAKLIQKLDHEIGEILDEDEKRFKDLDVSMSELEEKEFLTESESFQNVRNKIKILYGGYSAVKQKRLEKLEYEEKLRIYFKEVEKFFDSMINNYTENLELM